MRIEEILSQNRRDFRAIFKCEHCGHEIEQGGYDDAYYHREVVPTMRCEKCDKTAADDYTPRATKYEEGYQI